MVKQLPTMTLHAESRLGHCAWDLLDEQGGLRSVLSRLDLLDPGPKEQLSEGNSGNCGEAFSDHDLHDETGPDDHSASEGEP